MKTFAASFAAAAALAGGAAALHSPAQAQSGNGNIMEVIVYGNDPCPRSTEAEVVVCVRRGEAERYRIPENYRSTGPRQSGMAWSTKARQLEMVSDTGTFSCSAVGPGGHTGCLEQMINQSLGQRGEAVDASAPPQ